MNVDRLVGYAREYRDYSARYSRIIWALILGYSRLALQYTTRYSRLAGAYAVRYSKQARELFLRYTAQARAAVVRYSQLARDSAAHYLRRAADAVQSPDSSEGATSQQASLSGPFDSSMDHSETEKAPLPSSVPADAPSKAA